MSGFLRTEGNHHICWSYLYLYIYIYIYDIYIYINIYIVLPHRQSQTFAEIPPHKAIEFKAFPFYIDISCIRCISLPLIWWPRLAKIAKQQLLRFESLILIEVLPAQERLAAWQYGSWKHFLSCFQQKLNYTRKIDMNIYHLYFRKQAIVCRMPYWNLSWRLSYDWILESIMMPGPGRNGRQADTHLTERENDGTNAAIGLFP